MLAASAIVVSGGVANARQLTPEEALASVPAGMLPSATRSASPNLVYTQKTANLNAAYIMTNGDGNGYMVVAADDALPALLGYADRGSFDPNNIPPAMQGWLEEYGRQLEYAAANGMKVTATRATGHTAIAPLCKSQWGQDAPFNELTPESSGVHCPVGCTATAMAQVAYHHKWPVKGTGSYTYSYGSFQNLTFDYGSTEFEWDKMLDTYFGSYTEEQANAAATLSYACGVASRMQYAVSVSGAYVYDGLYGMVTYMGYDKGGYEAQRNYYGAEEWDELIYGELAANRPVIYSGYNSAGHTFIVDGYSENGFYHLNWGWAGTSDGYFLLSALDPATQGTGGSSSGYNSNQSAVIGLQPAQPDAKPFAAIYLSGSLKTNASTYTASDNITVSGSRFPYCTVENVSVIPGLKLTALEGDAVTFVKGNATSLNSFFGKSGSASFSNYTVPAANFPESGTYYATPAYELNDEVYDIHCQVGNVSKLLVTIDNGTITVEQVPVNLKLSASDIKLETPLYAGKNCIVTAKVTNEAEEYLGNVYLGLATSETETGKPSITMTSSLISLAPGETKELTFTGTFKSGNSTPATGTYYLNVYDSSNNALGTPVAVKMEAAPTSSMRYSLTYEFPEGLKGSGTSSNPYIVDNQLEVKIQVSVRTGFFDESIILYTKKYQGNGYYDGLGDPSASFIVAANQAVTKTFTLATSALPLNEVAYLYTYCSSLGGEIGTRKYIMRTESSSEVEEIGVDNAPVEYYNLQGVRVDNPTNGLYIRKQGNEVKKVMIK